MFRQAGGYHEHGWSIGNRQSFAVRDTIADHNKVYKPIGQALLPQTQTVQGNHCKFSLTWGSMLYAVASPGTTRRD